MVPGSLNRLRLRVGYVSVLLAILLVTLHLMSHAVQNSATLSRLYIPLLVISAIGLLILLWLVGLNLFRLYRAYRIKQPGARLTVRMVRLFIALSLVPVVVVFYYSMQFLQQGIDSWFDIEIDTAMSDALSLGKASLNLEKSRLLRQTRAMSRDLADVPEGTLLEILGELHQNSSATELTFMDDNGVVIASRNANLGVLVADTPGTAILQQVRETGSFVGITPYGADNLLHLRVVVSDLAAGKIVQALYPTSERVSLLSAKVEEAYEDYEQLIYLRDQLRFGFTLTLVFVLLFAVLGAVWAAIYSARKILSPIVNLAEATRLVADGDYNTRIPYESHRDELGFLVSSFNGMTQRISQARDEAARSQQQVESQRAYLQTLLEHLTTGVMTFGEGMQLRTVNSAASRITGVNLEDYLGKPVDVIASQETTLTLFLCALKEAVFEKEQQVVIETAGGLRTLRWQVTPLASQDMQSKGIVLMFDDVTALLQAQRDAAWGEVARRLAHEIKNPLTPIQLSAERLRRKYLPVLDAEQSGVLDRATHTIVQQVDALKQMVNAFSDYAKPSIIDKAAKPIEFDTLLKEVVTLYHHSPNIRIETSYGAAGAQLHADPVKLRQVIHNLVKNGIEALDAVPQALLTLHSNLLHHDKCHFIEFIVEDNGCGFDQAVAERVFDPYVTTKETGTGLGLAIVKKIVEEHGGGIWLTNRQRQGACVIVRLPVWREGGMCEYVPAPDIAGSEPVQREEK